MTKVWVVTKIKYGCHCDICWGDDEYVLVSAHLTYEAAMEAYKNTEDAYDCHEVPLVW